MVHDISQLIEDKYMLSREVKHKELLALQAQINPHFLYNTLELINAMAIEIENAILHGIMEKDDEEGCIRVTARREEEDVVIEVTDDGDNIYKETGGYGIRNVEERLKLSYGNIYALKIIKKVTKMSRKSYVTKLDASPVFTFVSYTIMTLIAVICVLPFVVLIAGAFSLEEFGFARRVLVSWPRDFSFDAFKYIFQYPENVLSAYKVSVIVTVIGTTLSLLLSTLAAYVISRKELKHRNKLAFFLFFTTLFNGGLAPYYIWITNNLKLSNTYAVLIFGSDVNVMYILILRSFIKESVPEPLVESAKMDGAGDLRIFFQMVLPLLKPALASIGIFTVLAYWNDWWTPMMFTTKDHLVPLQYLLYKMLSSTTFGGYVPLAMTVIATGPILLVFPFDQKYFVSGITIGSVKG
ncbi:unnamed protein product, partial [Mesorhabditis spiculigera]